jgi:hypothetical protein
LGGDFNERIGGRRGARNVENAEKKSGSKKMDGRY